MFLSRFFTPPILIAAAASFVIGLITTIVVMMWLRPILRYRRVKRRIPAARRLQNAVSLRRPQPALRAHRAVLHSAGCHCGSAGPRLWSGFQWRAPGLSPADLLPRVPLLRACRLTADCGVYRCRPQRSIRPSGRYLVGVVKRQTLPCSNRSQAAEYRRDSACGRVAVQYRK